MNYDDHIIIPGKEGYDSLIILREPPTDDTPEMYSISDGHDNFILVRPDEMEELGMNLIALAHEHEKQAEDSPPCHPPAQETTHHAITKGHLTLVSYDGEILESRSRGHLRLVKDNK